MTAFFIVGGLCALVPIFVGVRSFILPTGVEYTILGYTFLATAAYTDTLGFLWELIA